MEVTVGLRVVRGPDWKWSLQDNGEGHCGTVVEVGRPGSHTTPDKTVVVQWDSGSRTNYRIGYQKAYDLRVIDNATVGVRHYNILCNACKKHGIAGLRWKCLVCQGVDLCTLCYMNDKHDLNHPFARFETQSSPGVEMPKRSSKNNVKIQSRGIFVGARVVRGYDWDWANQDGGEGKVGKVIEIRGWDTESRRSVANVMWSSGSTNVYRVGHKGKVDLKYVADAPGPQYYRNHLPILGQQIEGLNRTTIARTVSTSGDNQRNSAAVLFNVGDKVQVIIEDVNELKGLQEGHGGWNQRMAEFIGRVGIVHRVTDKGDIRVQFEGCHNRWTFNPNALSQVISYSVGDIVKISDDINKVKELQKSHGEWNDHMLGSIGKMGKIVKVYDDHDLRVTVDGQTWTFNPQCVSLMPGSATEMNNTMISHPTTREDTNSRLGNLLEHEPIQASTSTQSEEVSSAISCPSNMRINKENLAREAAQGRIDTVRMIIDLYPECVDHKSSGKTALQVAAHQGHIEIVSLLLESGADINLRDDEGDTALHYAAFGNQSEIIELLLRKGSDIDAVNRTRCSSLHIAVNKNHINCVRVLLKYGCNCNLLDSYGDSALHDAIGKLENLEIIDALISSPGVNFSLRNRRGFNVLHHSALKGNHFATEKIISKSRQLVDCKKEDGFAALHLAALNGHYQIVDTLIIQGQADINIVNNRKQTPLMLAVGQSHCAIIELLIRLGANTDIVNEDNDSALHLAFGKCREPPKSEAQIANSPIISEMLSKLSTIGLGLNTNLAIACYMIQEGNADIAVKNRRGKTALDVLESVKSNETDVNTPFNIELAKEFILGLIEGRSWRSGPNHQRTGPLSTSSDAQPFSQSEAESAHTGVNSSDTPLGFVDINGRNDNSVANECQTTVDCILCNELLANVVFYPCGHSVVCHLCSVRIKKCVECHQNIVSKSIKQASDRPIDALIGELSIKSNDNFKSNNSNTISISNSSNSNNETLVLGSNCLNSNTKQINSNNQKISLERLQYLESKIAEIEEANSCTICMIPYTHNGVLRMAFLCGHSACFNCAQTLKTCHMCRKTITKKINLY